MPRPVIRSCWQFVPSCPGRGWNSIVTPGSILPRHAEYQIGDLLRDPRSTYSLLGIDPLLRDPLPMPGKRRVGCHQRLQSVECPAPQHLGLHGQSYPLLVGEPKRGPSKNPRPPALAKHAVRDVSSVKNRYRSQPKGQAVNPAATPARPICAAKPIPSTGEWKHRLPREYVLISATNLLDVHMPVPNATADPRQGFLP
jgi:hypothetical protein